MSSLRVGLFFALVLLCARGLVAQAQDALQPYPDQQAQQEIQDRFEPLQPGERRIASLGELAQGIGARPAVEWIGLSRSTLVDEDDVPRALNRTEHHAHLTGEPRGGLAGTTGEEKEGIRAGCRCHRWQDDNPEIDLASETGMAVLGNRDRPAQRIGRAFAALAGTEAVEGPARRRAVTRGRK